MLLNRLMGKIRKGDIFAFCSYATLARLVARGADSLMRLHQARSCDLRRGKVLGPLDRLVEWSRPLKCPPGCDKETFETLPPTLAVRLIGLRVEVPGFRSRSITLVTTLTDADLYPADELRELYAKRWNVELHFHQIKIALGMDVLRCQSPEMIEKEILVHLIAYNLIRAFMQRAAHIHHADISRMSFKGALDTSRHFAAAVHAASSTTRKQDALIAEMLAAIVFEPVPLCPL